MEISKTNSKCKVCNESREHVEIDCFTMWIDEDDDFMMYDNRREAATNHGKCLECPFCGRAI